MNSPSTSTRLPLTSGELPPTARWGGAADRLALLVALALTLLPGTLHAQLPTPPPPPAVATGPQVEPLPVHRSLGFEPATRADARAFRTVVGETGPDAGTETLLGALLGAALGALLGDVAAGEDDGLRSRYRLIGGVVLGVVGGLAGYAIGGG